MLSGECPCCHLIEGVAGGHIPPLLREAKLDGSLKVKSTDAIAMTRRLSREFGLLVGHVERGKCRGGASGRGRTGARGPGRHRPLRPGRAVLLNKALRVKSRRSVFVSIESRKYGILRLEQK